MTCGCHGQLADLVGLMKEKIITPVCGHRKVHKNEQGTTVDAYSLMHICPSLTKNVVSDGQILMREGSILLIANRLPLIANTYCSIVDLCLPMVKTIYVQRSKEKMTKPY